MAAVIKLAPLRLSATRSSMSRLASSAAIQSSRPSALCLVARSSSTRAQRQRSQVQLRDFHASVKRSLLPAPRQRVEGGVNDPAVVPEPHPTHGSYHWTFERIVCVGLVPLTIAPFVSGSLNPTMDAILCSTILIHSHVGLTASVIDYLPQKRVPKSRAIGSWGLRVATVLAGIGLYEFETNDVGVTEAIKRIWKA